MLDAKLNFSTHISYTCKKVSKLLGLLCKLKNYFPTQVLRNLYFSLIYPYLIYCIPAWGAANQTTLNPLIILQKRIIRILTNSDFYAHSSPLFRSLNILKIKDMFAYQTNILMYKALNQMRLPSLRNAVISSQLNRTHYTRNNNYRAPFCRLEKSKQTLLYQCITNWNSLPSETKNKNTINSFKKECKKHFLSSY